MNQKSDNLISRHPLAVYFTLAFAISWLIFSPGVAAAFGLLDIEFNGNLLALLGSFGPLLAAIIVTTATKSKTGVRHIFRNLLNWQIKANWWAAALLLLAGLFAVSALLALLTGGAAPNLGTGTYLIELALFLLITAVGEEVGWRGFALPKLQQTRSPLQASLILSLFWWLWHLPFYWTYPPAMAGVEQIGFLAAFGILQLVVCIALGLLCAWVYNGSRGALIMPVLLHASWNFWLFGFSGQAAATFALPLFLAAAIVVGLVTKGKLGFVADRQSHFSKKMFASR